MYLSIYLSIYLSFYLSSCRFQYLYLSINISLALSLSVNLFICLSVYVIIHLYLSLLPNAPLSRLTVYLFDRLNSFSQSDISSSWTIGDAGGECTRFGFDSGVRLFLLENESCPTSLTCGFSNASLC